MKPLAIVLALAACEKSEPPVPPDPVPTPAPLLDAGTLPISACYTIVLRIDPGGTWIGAPADVRCYAPFKTAAPDAEWIAAELLRLREKIDPRACRPVVEVGAVTGITYRQIVTVFEGLRGAAFNDLDVVEPAALSMTFDAAPRAGNCTGLLDTNKAARKPKRKRPPPPPPPPVSPGGIGGDLVAIQRISVSRDAIFHNGRRIVGIAELPAGNGAIVSLANALGTATDDSNSVVMSPDASTDATLLHRIVSTVKGAGYEYMSFEISPP